MKIVNCPKGHFYDSEKHAECPHCKAAPGAAAGGFKAMSIEEDEGKTVSYAQAADDEKTVAFYEVESKEASQRENAKPQQSTPVVGWLVCVEGPERGRDYRLFTGRNFVGRSLSAEVSIPSDPGISRENHLSIVFDPRSCRYIMVPGDSAATLYNGSETNSVTELADGDYITCGSTKLCFIGFCREGRKWH